jgi:hypothetical protein
MVATRFKVFLVLKPGSDGQVIYKLTLKKN